MPPLYEVILMTKSGKGTQQQLTGLVTACANALWAPLTARLMEPPIGVLVSKALGAFGPAALALRVAGDAAHVYGREAHQVRVV